ncbi:unnamed protein product [Caenorhabditis sp. 36 PRJEB53466]|nr:unnamed protein product [Caenorhabditis sp. 36 PRJEB53466]
MMFRSVVSLFLILLYTRESSCAVQIDVTQITIFFQNQLKNFLTTCNGVDIEFFLQLITSNYTTQRTYYYQQQPATITTLDLANSSTFQIQSPTDFLAISGILSLSCSVSPSPYADSFLLKTQSSKQPDGNNIAALYVAAAENNVWSMQATISRRCTGANQYGFNCNEECSATDDGYHCYNCGSNGQKTCCNSANVNPDDCSYYIQPASTTLSPNSQCSASAENTYFWLMISFAIIIVILAIILLLVILELCFGLFTGHQAAKGNEDKDWIVGNEPRANRELYDGDVNRQNYRRKNEVSRDTSRQEESRRSPYFVNREGLDNQTYDDESLRNQWVEPQPRRIARV